MSASDALSFPRVSLSFLIESNKSCFFLLNGILLFIEVLAPRAIPLAIPCAANPSPAPSNVFAGPGISVLLFNPNPKSPDAFVFSPGNISSINSGAFFANKSVPNISNNLTIQLTVTSPSKNNILSFNVKDNILIVEPTPLVIKFVSGNGATPPLIIIFSINITR